MQESEEKPEVSICFIVNSALSKFSIKLLDQSDSHSHSASSLSERESIQSMIGNERNHIPIIIFTCEWSSSHQSNSLFIHPIETLPTSITIPNIFRTMSSIIQDHTVTASGPLSIRSPLPWSPPIIFQSSSFGKIDHRVRESIFARVTILPHSTRYHQLQHNLARFSFRSLFQCFFEKIKSKSNSIPSRSL